MPTPNQIFKRREDVSVTAMDLLNMNMPGTITEDGIRKNLEIGVGYMEGWLRAVGCVPINYLMEDAATAEVSRSQVCSTYSPPLHFLRDYGLTYLTALAVGQARREHRGRQKGHQRTEPSTPKGGHREALG